MAEYKVLGNEEELEQIGGMDSRPIMNLEVDGAPVRVILKGMALVDAESKEGDMFQSLRLVVMMPPDFEGEELYESELATSFTGAALIPAAIKHFADVAKHAETGEIWLDKIWLNKECDIQIVTFNRESDAEKGFSPMKVLRASGKPMKTKRKGLTQEMSPAAGYQQPSAVKDASTGGSGEYQM